MFASTQKLYQRIAQGEIGGFTTPAFNLRVLPFDLASALFRAAKKEKAGAFIIELARSEMEYTNQVPDEFAKAIAKAAQKEGFEGPIFLQADHFKARLNEKEGLLEKLITQAIKAGFYNIDIDASELNFNDNIAKTAFLTKFIRDLEVKGITISVGGEVGEIGAVNTTPKEVNDFMVGYKSGLSQLGEMPGIIKLAVQTGTAHGKGGVIGWDNLKALSIEAKNQGLAGIVQHGASTLSDDVFERFPEYGVCEIHLSTLFSDMVLDSQYFPAELKETMHKWVGEKYGEEALMKSRKYAIGQFKSQINKIPQQNKDKIAEELEEKFKFFFRTLKVSGTESLVSDIYEGS